MITVIIAFKNQFERSDMRLRCNHDVGNASKLGSYQVYHHEPLRAGFPLINSKLNSLVMICILYYELNLR